MSFFDLFQTNTKPSSPYENLTRIQKLAAMNLMVVFGGSCSGTEYELNKINHIMSVEGHEMGISGDEVRRANSMFPEMRNMVHALKGANRSALEKLFWAFYCIIAVGESKEAVHVLLTIYGEFGFSEQECVRILEQRTGRKII